MVVFDYKRDDRQYFVIKAVRLFSQHEQCEITSEKKFSCPSVVMMSSEALWATQVTGCLQIAMVPRHIARTAAGVRKTRSQAVRWWTAQMTPTSSTPMDLSPR